MNQATPTAATLRFAAKLTKFCGAYKISLRQLAALLVNVQFVSKTTCWRLMHGTIAESYLQQISEPMETALEQFLRNTSISAQEIEQELIELFPDRKDREMITTRTRLDEAVLQHFNLARDPFALENDPRSGAEAFSSKEIERMARRVEDAINFQGFLCILGPVGAGKTNLKQRVAEKFEKNDSVHLLFPKFANMEKLNEGGIVHYLLKQFGIKPASRLVLAQSQLENHLSELNERRVRVAICFDECHRLSDNVLTSLKNFYELSTGGYDRFLALILFGQPQFKHRLDQAEFREITERLEILEMPPISRHAFDYVAHKLARVGGDINALFEKRAVELLAEQTATPLALGNLTAKAMLTAYEKGETKVIARFVETNAKPAGLRRVS